MSAPLTAQELERDAAAAPTSLKPPPALPLAEPLAMLTRRGFTPSLADLDLPFDPGLPAAALDAIAEALDRYAFRLFFRGAIQRSDGFFPEEATRFLTPEQAAEIAEILLSQGLCELLDDGRLRLRGRACSFGGTLEWYVARRLRDRYALDTVAGVKFHAPGVGGDLDVIAAAEGKLIVLELKSSPPKHLGEEEVAAFFDRVAALRPDVAIFAMDTALRLSDKVIPILAAELDRRRPEKRRRAPRRVERELWALTPHLYVANAKPNLISNIGRALAEGLRALAPGFP